jgi:hypothetical protein
VISRHAHAIFPSFFKPKPVPMKKILLSFLATACSTAVAFATPADDVKAAAKKLADAPNYSWTTTTENAGGGGGGFGGGPTSGKADKSGLSVTTREGPNGEMQTIRKGEQVVLQSPQDGQWVTMEEMMAQFGGGAGGAPGGGRGGRGGFGGMFGGGASPAEELPALVDAAKDLKAADGVISGALTDEGVTQRLGRGGRGFGGGGQAPAAPTNASGTVKFWIKDGAVAKYEVHVKGTVQGRGGPMDVDRTTTTEIKDVGTTKIDVPADAKKKLGA